MRLVAVLSVMLLFQLTTNSCFAQVDKQPSQEPPAGKTDFLGDPLPPQALLRLGTNRFTPEDCCALALSADGKVVVSQGRESLIGWDAESGRQLWKNRHEDPSSRMWAGSAAYGFRGLCRLPKSGQLASIGPLGAIKLLDFSTGKEELLKLDLKNRVHSIDVSPDESMFAVGTEECLLVTDRKGAKKYRIGNRPKKKIEGRRNRDRLTFGGEFSYARFSPDGNSLALVNSQSPSTIQILNSENGDVKKKIETKGYMIRLCFSSDSRIVFTTEQSVAARAYDLETGAEIWERVFAPLGLDERYTTEIAFSPAENELAVGTAIGDDQRIHLLNPATGETVGTLEGHAWKPWCLEYNTDGSRLYSSGWDSVIRRWDISKRQQISVENSERASGVCAMAPDGKSIAFGDDTGKLHIVEIQTGKKLRTIVVPQTTFTQIRFSNDGKLLAAGGSCSTDQVHVFIWNLVSGEEIHHWDWPKGADVHSSIEALSFSSDANRIAAAVFRQSSCYVFDLPSNKQIMKVRHPQVYGLCLRKDGQELVSAGWDTKIRLWDCQTGESTKEILVEKKNNGDPRMYAAVYAPDGQSLAALRMDNMIGIYSSDLTFIREFRMISGVHHGGICYSGNGLWLAVAHYSGEAAVYEVATGEQVWSSGEHQGANYNVEFSPDNRSLLSGGDGCVCYLWDLSSNPGDRPLAIEESAAELVGGSPKSAFAAHQKLASDPVNAVAAIQATLKPFFSKPDSETLTTQIKKLLQELESEDASIRTAALDELHRLGPAAHFAIVEAERDERIPENIQKELRHLQTKIDELHHGIRRAVMLLGELDSPAVETLLDELFNSSPNLVVKKIVFEARKHRKQLSKQMGLNTGT